MTSPSSPSSPPSKKTFRADSAPAVHRRRRWPYVAGALLVGLIVYGFWPKPIPVEVATATFAPLRVTVDDEGQTRVKNRYVITSPVAGHLRRIEHKAGAPVKAHETVLATLETGAADLLDTRSLAQAQARAQAATAAREQAKAMVARAQAAAALARTELERSQQLFQRGGISRQELDQASMRETAAIEEERAAGFALQVAIHEEEQARAVLVRGQPTAEAQQNQPLWPIISPVEGRVLRVFQESERLVPAGFPVLEVGDTTDLEVRIEVLSRDGVAIQPGAAVWLEQWGGREPLRARVRWVEPSAFTKISALGVEEQRVYVIADLVDPVEKRPSLGDAYRVEARVVLWENERVLQVPAGALFQRGSEWKLYAIEGGRARLRTVTVGHSNGLQTEIVGGVTEGTAVVIYPGDRVADGVRVSSLESRKP